MHVHFCTREVKDTLYILFKNVLGEVSRLKWRQRDWIEWPVHNYVAIYKIYHYIDKTFK